MLAVMPYASLLPLTGLVLMPQVLGALKLIDGGESDSKILVIREEEAASVPDLQALEAARPGRQQGSHTVTH